MLTISPLFFFCNFRDPPWFHETWISKIKQNVGSNVILKVSQIEHFLKEFISGFNSQTLNEAVRFNLLFIVS